MIMVVGFASTEVKEIASEPQEEKNETKVKCTFEVMSE